jgi:nucleotide-binding universal stress UspA family protein
MIDSRAMSRPLRILVGVDFSPPSRRALAVARSLAERSGASLTIAHVRPFSDIRAAVAMERGDLLKIGGRALSSQIRAAYEQKLAALARKGETTLLLTGAPDVALGRRARRGFDLLVLGRRGGGLRSVLPGSNAMRTMAGSKVPILIVPSGG